MAIPNFTTADELGRVRTPQSASSHPLQADASAVSWAAILAGATAAAALSLILLILGTGLGLSSMSPWANNGVSASTLGVSTIVWLAFTQLAASGLGGYLAGRLRTKWVAVHTDEAYFRDTAHGFLAWAVASLATAALLTSTIGSIISGGIHAGATVAGGVAATASAGAVAAGSEMAKSDSGAAPVGYFLDSLFRKDINAAAPAAPTTSGTLSSTSARPPMPINASEGNTSAEVARIFMHTIHTGNLPADDSRYMGQLVAQRTGLSQQEAEKRVTDTYARAQASLRNTEIAAKEAADQARKASAYAALWLFISLLIGAFFASLSATYGGRRRDI